LVQGFNTKGGRIAVLTDTQVQAAQSGALREMFGEVATFAAEPGESAKSISTLGRVLEFLAEQRLDRGGVLFAVGGGVIGDLGGFAAATYLRGIAFYQVPTTLLAMVDSSVGGKTGINHPRGKNLIGAFHQPIGVLIDLTTLATLPDREYRSGLAEVVKYGVILDSEFFDYLEKNVEGLNARHPEVLRHVVARSCELKADVVRQDEYETTGLRAVLNYGHTFGHAFEALSGYGGLLHGEAVSIGMICASRLAESLDRITSNDTHRQTELLTRLGLPVAVPQELQNRQQDIVNCMMLDKKTEGRELRFVLPSRIGHVDVVKGLSPEEALNCL
jgi:3-dehydroquinate synthase